MSISQKWCHSIIVLQPYYVITDVTLGVSLDEISVSVTRLLHNRIMAPNKQELCL